MAKTMATKLQKLLFSRDRELLNIKFMTGTAKDLTAERVSDEAASAIERAMQRTDEDQPPTSGLEKQSVEAVTRA